MNARITPKALLFTALVGTAGLAYAQSEAYSGPNAREVAALGKAKLSLTEAIQIAERETSGKAIGAEIEAKKNGTAYFEVEVFTNGSVQELRIDPNSGKVLETKAAD